MSNKYKHGDRIPSDVLCKRLDELANVVTQGRNAVAREFTMRVPAERDYDAYLVLSAASRRIAELEAAPTTADYPTVPRSWLEATRCPDVNCIEGRVLPEGDQCQWCDEKQQALNPAPTIPDSGSTSTVMVDREDLKYCPDALRDEAERISRNYSPHGKHSAMFDSADRIEALLQQQTEGEG